MIAAVRSQRRGLLGIVPCGPRAGCCRCQAHRGARMRNLSRSWPPSVRAMIDIASGGALAQRPRAWGDGDVSILLYAPPMNRTADAQDSQGRPRGHRRRPCWSRSVAGARTRSASAPRTLATPQLQRPTLPHPTSPTKAPTPCLASSVPARAASRTVGLGANPLPQGNNLGGAWGSGSNDVWAVGGAGSIVHWDGTTWSVVESGTTRDLNGVWGTGPSDVWAVGSGGILHWNGSVWSPGSVATPWGPC